MLPEKKLGDKEKGDRALRFLFGSFFFIRGHGESVAHTSLWRGSMLETPQISRTFSPFCVKKKVKRKKKIISFKHIVFIYPILQVGLLQSAKIPPII